MANHFSTLLRSLRREAGFQSAYAFYHRTGGRRIFPFTYAYYAKIEKGRSLPRSIWLPVLFSALRLQHASEGYRNLVLAYVRDSFGDDGLFDDMVGPWLVPTKAAPVHAKAVRRLVGNMSRILSHAQFDAILSSPGAMWAYFCLTKNLEPMRPEEIAKMTGMGTAAVRAGLETLRSHKLAERKTEGRYSSPMIDYFSMLPRHGEGGDKRARKLREIADKHSPKGRELFTRFAIVRAEEAEMLDVSRTLCGVMNSVHGCAVDQPGHRTGLYTVETRLKEVFRF